MKNSTSPFAKGVDQQVEEIEKIAWFRSSAIEIYKTVKGESGESSTEFRASVGWLRRFMIRYPLSLRRRTTQSKRMPPDLIPKIQQFILHFRKLLTEKYPRSKLFGLIV